MILDLSGVTDRLIDLVKSSWATAPIWQELGRNTPAFTPRSPGSLPTQSARGTART